METEKIEKMAKDLKLIKLLQASDIYTANYQEAKALFSLGYRKIPEDAVVLTREEYERLKRIENEKDRLYEIKLDLENQLIEKGWTDYEGADEIEKRTRKETVEKVVNNLLDFIHYETFRKGYELKKVERKVKELAKQFGVEIEE